MSHQFTAFMHNPDAPRPDNPIHSTDGGKAYGFEGALVGGIHVYGWTSDAFVSIHGASWLAEGWVDIRFRRPVYHGELMEVVTDGADFETRKRENAEVCLVGQSGMGPAPWFGDLTPTPFERGDEPDDGPGINLTMDNAPVGQTLPAVALALTPQEGEAFLPYPDAPVPARYAAETGLLHPSWIAGQMIGLLRKTYRYGPAIHTRSQIQHLAQGRCGSAFAMTGHCVEVFERKGHHYIVNDGSLWDAGTATELARLRHTVIFEVRKAS